MQHIQQPTQTQVVDNEEVEKLTQILANSEKYKEGTKAYKKLIVEKNQHTISVVVETVQRIIVEKQRKTPMIQLNAVRLAKECFELFVQEFMDQIGEKVLPIMSEIAHFQMENQKMDRGKDYFVGAAQSSGGTQELQVVGNSFFRLVLECIYVWAKWLPQTQFSDTYSNLEEQNVTFPKLLNYFKNDNLTSIEEILQKRHEQSQIRKMEHESKLKNDRVQLGLSEVKEEGLNEIDSHVRPSDQKQKEYNNFKDFGETRTGGGPDKVENENSQNDKMQNNSKNQQPIEENPIVSVNTALKHIQQVKSSLLEGLCQPKDMERSLLQYFHVEFEKFSTGAQELSQRLLEKNLDGVEDLFGNLFNENEFADLFVKHCDLYLANRTTWNEFQKPFEIYFKKPQVVKNNNNGDASTIGEYVSIRMQPNMLASDLNDGNVKAPKTFQVDNNNKIKENLKQINNRDDDNEPEETIKRNLDFTAENHLQKDNIASKGQQQQSQPLFSGSDKEKRTLRSAVSNSEVSKYKFEYKSRTNFSRLSNSANDSNLSAFNNNQPPVSPFSSKSNTNIANDQHNNIEELNQKLAAALESLARIEKERDSFKNSYNQAQIQLQELQKELNSANTQEK